MSGTLVAATLGSALDFAKSPGADYGPAMTSTAARIIVILSAIAAAAALRLVPHPPNFTPIGAMALFSGAYLGRRGVIAFAAPLGALLLSDAILGFYSGMAVNYLAVALIVLLGGAALHNISPLRLLGTALAASLLFFTVSNLGVWASSGMYPLTASGLAACYLAAIPFFQNTLAGDLFYSGLLFGGFALLERALPRLRAAPSVATLPLRR